jgi:ADP-ribosylation factor GTPase-activating protein 2/3
MASIHFGIHICIDWGSSNTIEEIYSRYRRITRRDWGRSSKRVVQCEWTCGYFWLVHYVYSTSTRYPERIYVQALEETRVVKTPKEDLDELDWLDSQIAGISKPKPIPAKPTISTSSPTRTLPGIGQRTPSSTAVTPTERTTTIQRTPLKHHRNPRRIPQLLLLNPRLRLQKAPHTTTLGATRTGTKLGETKGLGASKSAYSAGVFGGAVRRAEGEEAAREKEELVKMAQEDEERRRGEERRRVAEEARKKAGIATPPVGSVKPAPNALVDGASEGGGGVVARASQDGNGGVGGGAEMKRLGMGVRMLGLGAVGGVAAGAAAAKGKKKVGRESREGSLW